MTNKRHALDGWIAELRPPAALGPTSPTASLPAPTPSLPLALREVLSLPPAYLAQLPLATTLLLCLREGDSELWLWATSGRLIHAALVAEGSPTITARELTHLAAGAESSRASHEALLGWLQQGGPVHGAIPVESVAYGGAYALETPNQHWPLSQVLDAWGLTLVSVSVGDGPDCEVLV